MLRATWFERQSKAIFHGGTRRVAYELWVRLGTGEFTEAEELELITRALRYWIPAWARLDEEACHEEVPVRTVRPAVAGDPGER